MMGNPRLFDRLARRTTSGRYIPEVDGLRFAAILMVLLYHVGNMTRIVEGSSVQQAPFGAIDARSAGISNRMTEVVLHGQFGVHLFFVLSGFILALPFLGEHVLGKSKVNLRRYYARRVTRLEPPYLLALGLSFLLAPLAGASLAAMLPHLAAGSVYGHGLAFTHQNPLNSPLWSLEVEIQFYLLLPALAALFLIQDKTRRRFCFVFSALALTALGNQSWIKPNFTFPGFAQFFIAGFFLADVYLTDWNEKPETHATWDLVSLIGWPLLFIFPIASRAFGQIVLPWLAVLLFCAAFRGPITRRFFSNVWIRTTGGMAYSIYLLHIPLMVLATKALKGRLGTTLGHDGRFLLFSVVLIPASLAVGLVFYVLVERPCMEPNWPRRLVSRIRIRERARQPHSS